jgi:hypothetical protein
MRITTGDHKGVYYANVIKDNGGVLVGCGGTTLDAARQNLRDEVKVQFVMWACADYMLKLMDMTDLDLSLEMKFRIERCTGNNNPESDEFWKRDATRNEGIRRGSPDLYTLAEDEVSNYAVY